MKYLIIYSSLLLIFIVGCSKDNDNCQFGQEDNIDSGESLISFIISNQNLTYYQALDPLYSNEIQCDVYNIFPNLGTAQVYFESKEPSSFLFDVKMPCDSASYWDTVTGDYIGDQLIGTYLINELTDTSRFTTKLKITDNCGNEFRSVPEQDTIQYSHKIKSIKYIEFDIREYKHKFRISGTFSCKLENKESSDSYKKIEFGFYDLIFYIPIKNYSP